MLRKVVAAVCGLALFAGVLCAFDVQATIKKVDTSGLVPLTDLGAKEYRGFKGGLYPDGQNSRPAHHEAAGLKLAKQVRPLDAQGQPSQDGKIVLLGIGFSNTVQGFSGFLQVAKNDNDIHPQVVLVNGAVGGMSAEMVQNPSDNGRGAKYWATVDERLKAAQSTRAQVQVIWIKETNPQPHAGGFPKYAQALEGQLANIVRILPQRFPNLKLVYLSSRTYGGWAKQRPNGAPPGNSEPYSYETGFAVKWLIEAQLNGGTDLNFDANQGPVKAPWLSWGPYLWANGSAKRADNFHFELGDYREDDRMHHSPAGMVKVGKQLLDFFKTDTTTREWFVRERAKPDAAPQGKLDQWPHWRGPNGNGAAPQADPPITWDDRTNIKWKTPLPGRGSATPIVWGDQVFIVTAVKTGRIADRADLPKVDRNFPIKTTPPDHYYQFVVLAFDRQTGKLRWKHTPAEKIPHEGHQSTHSYAAGSPTTNGRFLYVSFGSFGIYCYDLDGKLQWQRDLGRLNTRYGWGEAVTPVIHGDSLLLNWDQEKDSALICLDAKTGKTKWRTERDDKTSWNTPLVVEHKGQTQVIVNGTKRIRSYDLATGADIWQCAGMTVNAIPSPVAANGIAYIMSGYTGAGAVAVPLDSRGDLAMDGKVVWRINKGTPYVPSPLLAGDRLYFTQANDASYTVLDLKTGGAILDRERLPGVGTFYASPIAAAGRIYLVDRGGTTLVLRQADRLQVLATNRLDDTIDASPVAVGRQLFLRGEKYLYCIEGK